MNLAAQLSRSRAFHGLSEDDCQIWFGVGIGTIERIEAGEVEPSEELEQRIDRFLKTIGSGGGITLSPSPTLGSLHAHCGGSTGAGGTVAPASGANFGGAVS